MLFRGIEIYCPHCRGELVEAQADGRQLECSSCERSYPIILGIPDLRIFPDPYIDVEADRAKGLKVAEQFDHLDFAEVIDYYYSITDVVPAKHAQQYKRGLLAGVFRANASLDAWTARAESGSSSSSKTLLDIGCGTAPLLVAAAPHYSKLVGVDIAFRWLVVAKKRLSEQNLDIPLICACAEALPLTPESFDLAIADSVIEHLQDQEQALKEIHRVLKPNGSFYLSTPNRFSLGPDPHTGLWAGSWLPAKWTARLVRRQGGIPPKRTLLSANSLVAALRDAGFTVASVFAPTVSVNQQRYFGRGMRFLINLYNRIRNLPTGHHFLLRLGPILLAVAKKVANASGSAPNRKHDVS